MKKLIIILLLLGCSKETLTFDVEEPAPIKIETLQGIINVINGEFDENGTKTSFISGVFLREFNGDKGEFEIVQVGSEFILKGWYLPKGIGNFAKEINEKITDVYSDRFSLLGIEYKSKAKFIKID